MCQTQKVRNNGAWLTSVGSVSSTFSWENKSTQNNYIRSFMCMRLCDGLYWWVWKVSFEEDSVVQMGTVSYTSKVNCSHGITLLPSYHTIWHDRCAPARKDTAICQMRSWKLQLDPDQSENCSDFYWFQVNMWIIIKALICFYFQCVSAFFEFMQGQQPNIWCGG